MSPEHKDGSSPVLVTVDVEDWPQSTWDHSLPITERSLRNAEHVLDVLAEYDQKATMFVLGKFAETYPDAVRRMITEGHEVASHGYGHVEIFHQTPEEFRQDIWRAKHLLEDITGQPVLGYRAPDFSIIDETLWAFDILAETGHRYDASVFPIRMDRYGINDWPTKPVRISLRKGRSISAVPVGTVTLFGRRWPVGGGGYHRLLPWPAIYHFLQQRRSGRRPFVVYCHPYEFDAAELRELSLDIPLSTRLHQGMGRRGFQAKFERILDRFGSERIVDVIDREGWPTLNLQEYKRKEPVRA